MGPETLERPLRSLLDRSYRGATFSDSVCRRWRPRAVPVETGVLGLAASVGYYRGPFSAAVNPVEN